eukprot:7388325-Prymnesium_polylepis.2
MDGEAGAPAAPLRAQEEEEDDDDDDDDDDDYEGQESGSKRARREEEPPLVESAASISQLDGAVRSRREPAAFGCPAGWAEELEEGACEPRWESNPRPLR